MPDLTPLEAAEKLESLIDYAGDTLDDALEFNLREAINVSAYYLRQIADGKCKHKQAAPKNKPLTLEELRKMDGEPVWVVNPEMETAEWMLCDAKRQICIPVEGYFIEFSRYGIEWLAYARRPEGSEK